MRNVCGAVQPAVTLATPLYTTMIYSCGACTYLIQIGQGMVAELEGSLRSFALGDVLQYRHKVGHEA